MFSLVTTYKNNIILWEKKNLNKAFALPVYVMGHNISPTHIANRTFLYDLIQQNHLFLVRPHYLPRGLWRTPVHATWTCWGARVQDEMGWTQWRKWDIPQWDCFCFSLITSFPSHSPRCSTNHWITEYSELEGFHKDHEVQLYSEWPMQGLNPQPWCYQADYFCKSQLCKPPLFRQMGFCMPPESHVAQSISLPQLCCNAIAAS